MNYDGVGIIIENQRGDFLLHLRDGNTSIMTNQWCLVGGATEPGENILDSALREVKEETGLTLIQSEYIKSFPRADKLVALVKGTVDTDREHMVLGEGADLKFFSRSGVVALINSLDYSNPYLEEFSVYLADALANEAMDRGA
jgi:8-oxo-dGTP pyrophosphatase MutT (NUDIX family)